MVARKYAILLAVIAALGGYTVYHFYFTEEARVKKRFALLAERLSKEPGESKLMAAASVKKALSLFERQITLEIPARSISRTMDRRDISAPLYQRRTMYSGIDLRFYDFHITFPKQSVSEVTVTLHLTAEQPSGAYLDEIHEVICILARNQEDDWLFRRIEAVEVLER